MTIIEITNNDDDHQAYIILAISYMVNRKVFLFFHFFFLCSFVIDTRPKHRKIHKTHRESRTLFFVVVFFCCYSAGPKDISRSRHVCVSYIYTTATVTAKWIYMDLEIE